MNVTDILAQRASFTNVIGSGIAEITGERTPVAVPVFTCASCDVARQLQNSCNPDTLAVPRYWTVVLRTQPFDSYDDPLSVEEWVKQRYVAPWIVRAATAAGALDLYGTYLRERLAVLGARSEATAAARAFAQSRRWSALKGSEKQIDWAETIRATYAKEHPEAMAVFGEKLASKWWIENSAVPGQLAAAAQEIELKIEKRNNRKPTRAEVKAQLAAAALAARTPAQVCADDVAALQAEIDQGQPWLAYCASIQDDVVAQIDRAERIPIEKNRSSLLQFRATSNGRLLSLYAAQRPTEAHTLIVRDDTGYYIFAITTKITAPMIIKGQPLPEPAEPHLAAPAL